MGGGGGDDGVLIIIRIFSLSGPLPRFMSLEALRRGSIYPPGTLPSIAMLQIS